MKGIKEIHSDLLEIRREILVPPRTDNIIHPLVELH
jgi:hypothetical protein